MIFIFDHHWMTLFRFGFILYHQQMPYHLMFIPFYLWFLMGFHQKMTFNLMFLTLFLVFLTRHLKKMACDL
jgi:phosphatidylglycerophosphatase A